MSHWNVDYLSDAVSLDQTMTVLSLSQFVTVASMTMNGMSYSIHVPESLSVNHFNFHCMTSCSFSSPSPPFLLSSVLSCGTEEHRKAYRAIIAMSHVIVHSKIRESLHGCNLYIENIGRRGYKPRLPYMLFFPPPLPPPPPPPLPSFYPLTYSHTYSDYGFKPANGLNGPCVRDEAVPLDDPCADGQVKTVMKSRGYRKVTGDLCTKGSGSPDFDPYEFTCCSTDAQPTNTSPSASTSRPTTPSHNVSVIFRDNKSLVTGLGVALAIAIVIAMTLGLVAAIFVCR